MAIIDVLEKYISSNHSEKVDQIYHVTEVLFNKYIWIINIDKILINQRQINGGHLPLSAN